jgi:7-keto-8-aminopelargonate synthetase-like enzyme
MIKSVFISPSLGKAIFIYKDKIFIMDEGLPCIYHECDEKQLNDFLNYSGEIAKIDLSFQSPEQILPLLTESTIQHEAFQLLIDSMNSELSELIRRESLFTLEEYILNYNVLEYCKNRILGFVTPNGINVNLAIELCKSDKRLFGLRDLFNEILISIPNISIIKKSFQLTAPDFIVSERISSLELELINNGTFSNFVQALNSKSKNQFESTIIKFASIQSIKRFIPEPLLLFNKMKNEISNRWHYAWRKEKEEIQIIKEQIISHSNKIERIGNSAQLKDKHEMVMDIVNKEIKTALNLGLIHLFAEDSNKMDGREVTINGKKLLSFVSNGYLGLELDNRLIEGAIQAVRQYGTQFSTSRVTISSSYYQESEALLSKMFFNKHVLLLQSLTVGHMTNIPTLVGNDDAVIMDSQVHDSVQTAVQFLKNRDVHVEIIRHNRLDMLESRIKELKDEYKKIWYMADGVYSMQGDLSPVKELYKLADQYEQLHLYIDDIQGMSWVGPNGTGYVTSQGDYHPRLYLTTGLTKAFGTTGGLLVYPDEISFQLVKNTSKAFIFSIQMPPMILGATIESAKIHLSNEIYTLQEELADKVVYFNMTAKKLGLPLISESISPIGFIGVGKPDVGYNMVRRMMKQGYFFNLSVFPSVSYNNTGMRITLNRLHTYKDIESLLKEISVQLPMALEDSQSSMNEINKFFRRVA